MPLSIEVRPFFRSVLAHVFHRAPPYRVSASGQMKSRDDGDAPTWNVLRRVLPGVDVGHDDGHDKGDRDHQHRRREKLPCSGHITSNNNNDGNNEFTN